MDQAVERLRDRDAHAWAELYDRHVREIYGYVFHSVGGNVAVAEELTQETWTNAIRAAEQLDATQNQIRAWLFAIARSQIALYFRRQKVAAGAFVTAEDGTVDPPSRSASPSDELAQRELINQVRASLIELPDLYRDLLLSKYVDRKTVAELASEHGKTDKAIEGLLSRARAELRSLLNQSLSPGNDP